MLNKLALQSCGESLDGLKAQLREAQEKITVLEEENNRLKAEEQQAPAAVAPEGETPAENPEAPPEEAPAPEEPAAS